MTFNIKFGPKPDLEKNIDLKKVEKLPFQLNLGDAPLNEEHKKRLFNLIYADQEVFSLLEEDLEFCDHLYH